VECRLINNSIFQIFYFCNACPRPRGKRLIAEIKPALGFGDVSEIVFQWNAEWHGWDFPISG
jgi:hypothetical protein